ncbi:hypothetical protein Y032_0081g1417 [Ancylostoma ceylanicum]|uniref:Uncharacterized protein n=1 Tax=Ancylostoma ceylanicum TaxID=53326 RepID=A0A016TR71_9BILA|nr:hypothetical protein Y032_0081g1417 [Ancylostoma ceylanicum]
MSSPSSLELGALDAPRSRHRNQSDISSSWLMLGTARTHLLPPMDELGVPGRMFRSASLHRRHFSAEGFAAGRNWM